MIVQPSFGSTPMDPNASRVIEELASVINDVELRLQAVKFGLAQAFPQIAAQRSFGQPGFGSIPLSPTLAPQGLGFATPFATPFSTFGHNPYLAYANPWAIPTVGYPGVTGSPFPGAQFPQVGIPSFRF